MTADAVRISMVNVDVPVTPPPTKRPRRAAPVDPGRNVVELEIWNDHCRVWDHATHTACEGEFMFDPAKRADLLRRRLWGERKLTDIPFFADVFRVLSEQYAANRTNPLGAFLRNMVVAMERDLAEAEGACVYFALADDRVKIGWSKRVASRIAELQTGNPSPLKLLGVVPGARAMERQMHERFAHLRLSGEWFRAAPELLAYIAQPTP